MKYNVFRSKRKIKKQFDPRARNLKTLEKRSSLNDEYQNEAVMDSDKKSLVEKIKILRQNSSGQEKLQVDLEQTQRTEFSKIEKIVNDTITEYAEKMIDLITLMVRHFMLKSTSILLKI